MPRKIDLAPKKLPRQRRAVATVEALAEAATYILAREGLGGFTANKVAEKAGVNIASFYQYFPNKEALLFHIVRQTWERQLARLSPILTRPGEDHAVKLRDFVREFFLIEAAEVDLRRALRAASVDLKETEEFRALLAAGADLTKRFIAEAVGNGHSGNLDFDVRFVVLLTTSFAERTTDEGTGGAELIRQADPLTDMLVARFNIA
ncbi:transcriptional regulator, TetR family [Kaistia soli DSM 19436]|uniref:Transcriptional regulator, TetR family n=1 Tax=Kaistia soli DSM 19436 TaxID=1122133 RepID=A0A1M5DXR8_9HYPH|nr:TetR/AcrR family transcriptional regulator [Kaistia soli]SHF71787.1 transcriptional regulator, TetR family [Kaistia soli DSM 19436]